MPGLDRLVENAWDLGIVQSGAAELEPVGSAELVRGLIADDGLPYRRGGSTYKSSAAAAAAWVVDVSLRGGQRTVFGTSSGLYTLDVDDVTPLLLHAAPPGWTEPVRAVVVDDRLVVEPASTGYSVLYGGARKPAYSTGTVTVTLNSQTVTGSGTSWLANVEAGMFLGVGGGEAAALIDSVDSNTQLTLRDVWLGGAGSGLAYNAVPVTATATSTPAPVYYGTVANRLVRMNGPTRMDFTQVDLHGADDPDDLHRFPAQQLGYATLRDVLLVFTTGGVWSVSGMAYALTDQNGNVQHRRELVNADLVAWGRLGIAPWAGSLIVPAVDNVYLMDNLGAPTPIGGRIIDLYLSYVRAGYKPGIAEVFNGHYLLPVLTSGNAWVDTLVCRLQPTHSNSVFGWTRLAGVGAQVFGFAERSASPPALLAASTRVPTRLLDVTSFFNPGSAKADADGSAHDFVLTTRNVPTGGQVANSVLYVQLAYVLTDAASDDPVFTAEVNADDAGWVALEGEAPEGGAGSPHTWPCSVSARHVRFRFTSSLPSAFLKVEALSIFVRKSGLYL
jgi:hypothetical protein